MLPISLTMFNWISSVMNNSCWRGIISRCWSLPSQLETEHNLRDLINVKGIWPLWPCGHRCIEREEPQKVKVFLQKNLGRPFLLLDLSRCKDVKWRVGLTKKKKMKKKRTVDGFLLQCSGWLLARPPSKGSRRLNAIIQLTHSDQNFCNSTPRSTSRGPKGSQPVTGDQRVRLINHWNQA